MGLKSLYEHKKQVHKFKYLYSITTSDARDLTSIKMHINKAKGNISTQFWEQKQNLSIFFCPVLPISNHSKLFLLLFFY